jgi:hypothetical protein
MGILRSDTPELSYYTHKIEHQMTKFFNRMWQRSIKIKRDFLSLFFAGDNLRSLHTNSSSDFKVSTFFVVLLMMSSLVLIQCLNGSLLVGDYPLRITEREGEKDICTSKSPEERKSGGCVLRKSSEIVVVR